MKKLFTAAAMIDGTSSGIKEPGALLVEDHRITATGERALHLADGETLTIDLNPSIIIPGLIDSHVHLVAGGKAGALAEISSKSDLELTLQGAANMAAAIRSGVTTVRDCGGVAEVAIALREASRSGLLPGPRILSCGAPLTVTGGHCHFFRLEAEGPEEVLRAMRRMHKIGADFFKVMVTGGGSTPRSIPAAPQYGEKELRVMVDEARRLGKKITGHAHGTEGIKLAVEAGFDGIEHCSWLDRNGRDIRYDDAVVDLMVEKGTIVCRTIAGFERLPLEDLGGESPSAGAFVTLRKMVSRGIPIIAGTDAGIDNTDFTGLNTTLETMTGLGGMDAAAVLDSATRGTAVALGCANDIGTLEPGKLADVIAVDKNPVEDLRALREVEVVILGGEVVYRRTVDR